MDVQALRIMLYFVLWYELVKGARPSAGREWVVGGVGTQMVTWRGEKVTKTGCKHDQNRLQVFRQILNSHQEGYDSFTPYANHYRWLRSARKLG